MRGTADYIKDECLVLLDRAFTGQSLTFFGEDGGGKYGSSVFPLTCRIRCIDLEFEAFSDDASEIRAFVRFFLDGYDADVTGHAITDANLRINLDTLLKQQVIIPNTLEWADLRYQGRDFITLSLNVEQLLSW